MSNNHKLFEDGLIESGFDYKVSAFYTLDLQMTAKFVLKRISICVAKYIESLFNLSKHGFSKHGFYAVILSHTEIIY